MRSTAVVLAAVCALSGAPPHAADTPINLALIADGATQEQREPLRAYLAKAMGRPVKVTSPDAYRDTVGYLVDGSYDFACLGALVYIRARARYGVIPLVHRSSDLEFHSVFITGANSSIHSLSDLKGTRFAFGDIDSTSGHLMPYRELMQAGIVPETDLQLRYSGSHPATAALVETGVVDAGAMDETVFRRMIRDGKIDGRRVRVFYTTKPYIDYVYVARRGVPVSERERFARALLALKEGKDDAILEVLSAKQFVLATDQEYAPMRLLAHELKMF